MKYLLLSVVLFWWTTTSSQTVDSMVIKQVDSLIQVSRKLTGQRKFEQALSVNAEAERLAIASFGKVSAVYSRCCFDRGDLFYAKGDKENAEKWYLESIGILENTVGKEHPDYASALNNLANLYVDIGHYDEAELLYLETKDIRENVFGKEDPVYASCLSNLGFLYWKMQQFEKAEPLHLEAKAIREKALGKDHLDYALSLTYLGLLYDSKGQYERVEPLHLEAKAIREKALGKEHPDYAESLFNLALVSMRKGQFGKAESAFLEAKTIFEKTLGKDHLFYASSLNLLGYLYSNIGQYEKAEPLLHEFKDITEKTLGNKHPEYANSLNNLAVMYGQMGRYEKAEPLLLESEDIRKNVFGKEHPAYAVSLDGLAILYMEMGQYKKAEPLYIEAKAIWEKTMGREHPNYARSLNNLANLYGTIGQYEEAELLFIEAKDIREKAFGKAHPEYAQSLGNLAVLYVSMGQYKKAESLFLEALTITEEALGRENPSCANILDGLAKLYMNNGQNGKAEPLFLESLAITEKILGEENQEYASILRNLTILYNNMGQIQKAEPIYLELSLTNKRLLEKASLHLSERELHIYLNSFSASQNSTLLFTQVSGRERLIPACYDNSLFYKGFLLQSAGRIRQLALSDTTNTEKFNRLKGYQRRLATLYSMPITDREGISELEEKANLVEKELARAVAAYSDAIRQVKWEDVKANLKTSEAAIEFVHFQVNFPKQTDSTMYAALLILPGSEQPMFIPLFEEKALALLVSSNTERKADYVNELYTLADRGLVKLGTEKSSLYELIWKPLEAELSEVNTVYFSPSGLLHRINIDAIPVSELETIADKYQMITLNSTRQIVIPTKLGNTNNDAVLFGGIQFEQDANIPNNEHLLASRSRGDLSFTSVDSTLRGGTWNYLAGTEREVNTIENIMQTAAMNTTLKKGYEATEESFKNIGTNQSPSPRILHIATHGYFFPDPTISLIKGGPGEAEPVFKLSDHPMLRSGLILAGGNAAWQGNQTLEGREDGILTAYEISQMNLSNTELVVLSACETGLGEIQGNEGVYGLQRAFKIAGAKYLIMSLWQVPDKQTSLLMTTFYKKWLENKMTIPDAFHAAQKELRDVGLDPYQWAGFVLVE